MSLVEALTVSLDNILWFAGIVAEAAVVWLLLYKRVWRTLPVFCVYCAWALLSDAGNYLIHSFFLSSYLTAYFAETVVDSILEFGILVELAWSVLRPVRASLPRSALLVVAVLIAVAGAAIWPFAGIQGLSSFSAVWRSLVHVQQTASILRILFFLLLAGGSQFLSIGWRDRELQVATGLGFYSIVSVAVAALHSRQAMGQDYRYLNRFAAVSYLCSLFYWVVSFAQQEAKRREFSPQMRSALLAVAGTARANRIALEESGSAKAGKR
ncbi:MAG: hypothetical protein ABR898_03140 [Terracidiphilus sp.]|jgi:hypothetical protein